jgi:pimeloyl-ACP methyl ester carboxylesterase
MRLCLSLCVVLPAYEKAYAAEVLYQHATVDGIKIFYRESGDPSKPTIMLLHGFPSSSAMFRKLIPLLSDRFHLVAPDYPGMGNSEAPPPEKFHATFDGLGTVVHDFASQIGAKHFIIYMQDFGGPVGMRIAVDHPEMVDGLIFQNTPISLSGWDPSRLSAVQSNIGNLTPDKRAAIESRVSIATSSFLHQKGATQPEQLDPDSWAIDALALADPEKRRIMTDLQMDIPSNFSLYPKWQEYLKSRMPKTLVVWGQNDPIFTTEGAEAIKQANPNASVHLYNTGHFALDENSAEIAEAIKDIFAH